MSDHTSALVPLESWCYMSPELPLKGKLIDIGLFAEALIYYDRVFVTLPTPAAFADFIFWFVDQGKYEDLLALIKDEVIVFYHYAFYTNAVRIGNIYSIYNIQGQDVADSSAFESQYLTTANLIQVLPRSRQRARLYKAVRGRFTEVKASSFGTAIDNAKKDYGDPQRSALLIQALMDEIFPLLNLKEPPIVKSQITEQSGKVIISWNVNFEKVSQQLGKGLNFHPGSPLSAAASCNRILWSAAELGCDIYLNAPMSTLVGDKLYESGQRLNRSEQIIEQLQSEVEFPNIRQLVNEGFIGLNDVLTLRRKGELFRKWLQSEGDRDRNALFAYHNEVARESGWTKGRRKTLRLFGVLGGPAAGAAIGAIVADPILGSIVGAAGGAGITYLMDVGSKLNQDWRPVVFGNWMQDRIEKLYQDQR